MKKIKHIVLASIMAASMLLGVACHKEEIITEADVPDYSGYNHQFDFFGYHSAHDGFYSIDGVKYDTGGRFLTAEQYQMYKDVGMTMFYPQSILKIRGDKGSMRDYGEHAEELAAEFYADRQADWDNLVKPEIDELMSIGIDKTILYDEDLSWLGLNEPNRYNETPEQGYDGREDEPLEDNRTDGEREARGLIGDHKDQFKTEAELDAQVEKLLSVYAGYPGVYGVCLADEPKNVWYQSYGDLYNSIKRVSEKNGWNLYISYNLNPLNVTKLVYEQYYPYVEGTGGADPTTNKVKFEDGFARYKQYIENFMASMQPDYIRYDDYPLREGYLSSTYIPCLEYVAGVARDNNIDFHMVTQTFEMNSNGERSMRTLTESGAKWLNNMLLGFSVNEISYFTYYTRSENRTDGESFPDQGSFMTLYGKKTYVYDMMQEIMADNQRFAPTVLQFKYKKSGIFTKPPLAHAAAHIQYMDHNVQTYDKVTSVSVNKECAMVNEMYDEENKRYMYMAMNIVDPIYQGSTVYQTITLEFASEYKYAVVYRDGEKAYYRLNDSKLNIKAAPGEASFIIPF